MSPEIRCPRCEQAVSEAAGCRHLRWAPSRGGPVAFAESVIRSSPTTTGGGYLPSSISSAWLEAEQDWLLERISRRLDVIDGYCFGEPGEADLLCLDIWRRFAPEPDRASIPRTP